MPRKERDFDLVVVGGGHAGCEAYAAACRVGARAALIMPRLADAAFQPCNPAVGGPGKGHLVREVVALGGLMGRVTDLSGIQFRTLNSRKGPAVRATRVQTDSAVYTAEMAAAIGAIPGGELIEDRVVALSWERDGAARRVTGVRLEGRGELRARAVVVATGTFLRGVLFTGDGRTPGGRRGAPPAVALAESLEHGGLPLVRLKTGTCPRLDGSTIRAEGLEPQPGERPEPFFDPDTRAVTLPQLTCYLTYTGEAAHDIVRRNLETSAMYSGAIQGIGPRYCPSFETKVAEFPDRGRHQIFLEPEDREGRVIYPSGLSTSLPEAVQEELVRAIPGLEEARIVRYGYAVEYDAVQPRVLTPSLEVDGISGLYLAGQIIGTSGYEEAAVVGLLAGANAALAARGDRPIVLPRDVAYAGVMVDDLTSRGVDEPYRMFTSRAEYRLKLREDNADERLLEEGLRAGLLAPERAAAVREKIARVEEASQRLEATTLTPSAKTNGRLREAGLPTVSKPTNLHDYLRRDGMRLGDLGPVAPWVGELDRAVGARVEVDVKYAGYLRRQESQAELLRGIDGVTIPPGVDFGEIAGLRPELVEKLRAHEPSTLGQVSRIPGMTPAAVQILHIYIEKIRAASSSSD